MPTIELTDEQAEELRDVLSAQLVRLADALSDDDTERPTADMVEARHIASVLSDILHLLEIA